AGGGSDVNNITMLPAAHQHTDQDRMNDINEQPGLELVPDGQPRHITNYSDAHVAGNPYYQSFDETGKEAIPTTKYTQIANVEDPPDAKPKRSRRRLWLTAGGVTLLIVILSAVLGGVFGSRAAKTSSADQTGASASPSPSPIATSQTIRQGSSLSVTGWRKSSGVEIFLFYQDVNNYVRCSKYEEVPTSSTLGNTSWHAPVRYNSFATSKSRLAGTIIQFGTGAVPQVEMFYTNDDNRLLGLSINNAISSGYEEDSIKGSMLSTGSNSSVAAYWPWITYQGPDQSLFEVRNSLIGDGFFPASAWDVRKLGIIAAETSQLALFPLSSNFSAIAAHGAYGIIYQASNNSLAIATPGNSSSELAANYALAWPSGKSQINMFCDFSNHIWFYYLCVGFTVPTISKGGSFAAFSIARESDALQRVNIYILFIDASFDINVLRNSASGWQLTQPAALKAVDSDSDIACLTMATTCFDSNGSQVLLGQALSETRCYFQRGGLVREAMLSGDDWVDLGSVPIP
ncbi:hypothetical protein JMJ77_0009186, partial [Colletotrichum scovillei]